MKMKRNNSSTKPWDPYTKTWIIVLLISIVFIGKNEAEDLSHENLNENPRNEQFYHESHSLLRAGRPTFSQNIVESQPDSLDNENLNTSRDNARDKRNLGFLFGRGRGAKSNDATNALNREEEARAAELILKNIITNNSLSENVPSEIVYHDDQAIAAIFSEKNSTEGLEKSDALKVTRCRILEVNKPEEAQAVLKMLEAENKLILKAPFHTMVSIITSCKDLDISEAESAETHTTTNPVAALLAEKRVNVFSIVSGILPGTKWCGTGDIAKDYDDLGREREVDKCCRAHDLCPTKVMAFRNRYGLVNWSFYTKSHCDCDDYFYNCLKKQGNPTAEAMGTFYFNVLRVQCVDDITPGQEDSEDRKLVEKEVRKEF